MTRAHVGVVAVWLVGCGGVIDDSKSDASANDGSASLDASIQKDAAGVDAAPPPPVDAGTDAKPLGYLYFEQDNSTPSSVAVFVGEFFSDTTQANQGCIVTSSGACLVYDCPSPPPTTMNQGAGTLTITGGPLGQTGTTIPQSNPYYFYTYGKGLVKGDVLGVSASGGQVPAFGPKTVTMPGVITLTSPPNPATIATSSDVTATWSNGETGASTVIELTADLNGKTWAVYCTFDAATGTGTIPKALLGPMKGLSGNVFWGQEHDVFFTAGQYPLQLTAFQYAYGSATFQ